VEDKRLFHRYPAGLRVAFRVAGEGFRGKITDVSAGGGFCASDALPVIGSRLQMAAQQERNDPSIWLDLRVTWVNEEPTSSHPDTGFGGYWLHASCRYGEERLRQFLASILGITKPVIRPMTPPAGGDAIFVYRFPDVYESDDEFPWAAERSKPPTHANARLLSGGSGARKLPARTHEPSSPALPTGASPDVSEPALSFGRSLAALDDVADFAPDAEDSGLQELVGLTQEEPLSVEHSSPTISTEAILDQPAFSAPADNPNGRWSFLVNRLTGIRTRLSGGGGSSTPRSGSTPEFGDADFVVKYKAGRKFASARVARVERSYLVMEPAGDVPEVWSRVIIHIPTGSGRKAKAIELNATVTRIKESGGSEAVHCKINRVDEKGMVGAFASYVEAFKTRQASA